MNRTGSILRIVVECLLVLYLCLLALVNTTMGQTWIAQRTSEILTELFEAPTHIERIEIGLFDQVTLHNVTLLDRTKTQVLKADYIEAKIELMPLISDGRISLRTIALLDADALINRDKEGRLNIQYLIDTFSSKDSTQQKPLNLSAGTVIMHRCHVLYKDELKKDNTLELSNINLNLSLTELTDQSIALRLRDCSMEETRGIKLEKLSLQLEATTQNASVRNLQIELPHSVIHVPLFTASYNKTKGQSMADLTKTMNIRPFSLSAVLGLGDITPLLPAPMRKNAQKLPTLSLNANAEMAAQRLRLNSLTLKDSRNLMAIDMNGEAHVMNNELHDGSLRLQQLHVTQELVSELAPLFDIKLPKPIKNLTYVDVSGQADMFSPQHGIGNIRVGSNAGTITMDGKITDGVLTTTLQTSNLALNQLLPEKDMPELVNMTLNGSTTLNGNHITATAHINHLLWRGLDYSQIEANGTLNNGVFSVQTKANNPYMELEAVSSGNLKLDNLKLEAQVENWSTLLPSHIQSLRGRIMADCHGLLTPYPTGSVLLSDLTAETIKDGVISSHTIKRLSLKSQRNGDALSAEIASEVMRAQFNGTLNFKAMKNAALQLAREQLPDFIEKPGDANSQGRWSFALFVQNTDFLEAVTHLPISLEQPLSAEGRLDAAQRQASLQAIAPAISLGGQQLKDLRLSLNTIEGETHGRVMAHKVMGKSHLILELGQKLKDGKLITSVNWSEPKGRHYYGDVEILTQLNHDSQGKLTVDAHFQPTSFVIKDTLWNISSGHLAYCDKQIDIHNLNICNNLFHSVSINGRYSSNPSDSIVATLHNIDLGYIIDQTGLTAVNFGGLISGQATMKMQDNKPLVDCDVKIPDFYFNHASMGEAHILGNFDFAQTRLNLDVNMEEPGLSHSHVTGFIGLKEKALDLRGQVWQAPIGFINKFLDGILEDAEGRATGNVRFYGPFKKFDLEGDIAAQADFTVPYTGVRYYVSRANVKFDSGLMVFSDAEFNDKINGHGIINGKVRHNHLKDMRYNFETDFENTLVYDMPQEIGTNFFSTAYGTGHAQLSGLPGRLQVDVNLTPTQGTDFTFINDTPEAVTNNGLVKFGSKRETLTASVDQKPASSTPLQTDVSAMDIIINLNLNVNPDAALHIIMDEKCGDVINLYGNGNVQASFYNKGDFLMHGDCTVDHGEYRLSIQDFIHRNFVLQQGGRITFTGNPMEANLDVKAIYVVNSASLADLNAGTSFSDNNIRVNCELYVTGQAGNPEIRFGIDLPTVNDDEKQMVRKLIATEEDLNMQIIYLLGIGRFYTYDATAQVGGANMLAASSVNSFLSSTLSNQLNEFISNALNTDKWSLGANLATGNQGWSDMEVEALLSGRLFNNRLLINGQFGYRDKATVTSSNNFIGDVDIQYLVTKNGNIRLRGYNETNDRYFTKSTLLTQGLGIKLQKDFGRIEDYLKVKRKKHKK